MSIPYTIDATEVRRAITLLAPEVFELRALNCKVMGEYRTGTYSGYFQRDAIDDLLAAVERIESASGVYFTPHHVNPDLLARCCNRARIITREPTTSDKDILARRWVLIDVDPVRPAGVSATDAEKSAARRMIHDIDHHLWERAFPPGIIGDSGNGSHLMIPMILPADDDGATKTLLEGLARDFDNEACKVDVTTFNPARIWKLPGTLACKGDDAPAVARPWRMARIVTVGMEVFVDA
ncbi:MAG: hypothetical protein K8T91_25700 [Planctomycetes bacterium]|nr:hypothetical protein [Planctomycetota bacterium]